MRGRADHRDGARLRSTPSGTGAPGCRRSTCLRRTAPPRRRPSAARHLLRRSASAVAALTVDEHRALQLCEPAKDPPAGDSLATNTAGVSAVMTTISSHEAWLARISSGSSVDVLPITRTRTPIARRECGDRARGCSAGSAGRRRCRGAGKERARRQEHEGQQNEDAADHRQGKLARRIGAARSLHDPAGRERHDRSEAVVFGANHAKTPEKGAAPSDAATDGGRFGVRRY